MTQFYMFNQNNSGGSFDLDEKNGVTNYTIVEANNGGHAKNIAITMGIYFDGCEKGLDCNCCGDRWSTYDLDKGTDVPMIYGDELTKDLEIKHKWMDPGKEACVNYLDGRKEWF